MAKLCTLCKINPQAKSITRCKPCNVDYMQARNKKIAAESFTRWLAKNWGLSMQPTKLPDS